MSSVLVGMFDTRAEAEQARSELAAGGFTPGAVTAGGESGAAATASTAGTPAPGVKEGMFSSFFHSIFGSDDAADEHSSTYKEAFHRGGFGLTVTAATDAEIDRASAILDDCGAFDIDERSQQWKAEGWTGAPLTGTGKAAVATDVAEGSTKKLNLVEESLAVGKRTVGRGGVRLFSRVVEVPVQESVQLRTEQVDVQRRVVDRPATEADFAAFQEGSIEVRSSAEEAVVNKTARVVGEVEIGKTVTEREAVIRDTVRKTEVDVEQLGGTAVAGTKAGASNTAADTATTGSANLDPITGEPGAHPVGTGVGAVAGGLAAGAAAGTVVGPVGTAVGAAVGAVAGGLAGKGVAEKVDPTVGGVR